MKNINKSSYNLFSLLINNFGAWARGYLRHYEPIKFPKKVDNFEFVSVVKKTGPRKSYPLAIYEDKNGRKAFAKMKDARLKGYHYYSLLNEIYMYEVLNKVVKRIGKKMPAEFKDIYIPKVIKKIEDKNKVFFLIEFIDGKVAQDVVPEEKISIYLKIIDFLHFIGNNLTAAEKRRISVRTSTDYIFLYPLLVVKALISYPKFTLSIIKGIPVFTASIPALLKNNNKVLTHRDLHFKNIMLSKGKIVLIDLQHCVYTDPIHEMVTTIRYWWKRDNLFYQLLLKEINNKYSFRKDFGRLFSGFIVNSATHGLTGKGYGKSTINNWVDFLHYGISTNK